MTLINETLILEVIFSETHCELVYHVRNKTQGPPGILTPSKILLGHTLTGNIT